MRLELATFVLVASLVAPTIALADPPSVRIARIEGDRGRRDERALTQALRDAGFAVGPYGDVIVRGTVSEDVLELRVRVDGDAETIRVEGRSPQARAEDASRAIAALLADASGVGETPERDADEPPEPPETDHADAGSSEVARPRASRRVRAPTGAETPRSVDGSAAVPARDVRSALSAELAGGMLRRRLAFRDDLLGTVSDYQLAAAPIVALTMSWFPGAHADVGHPLAGIGIVGDFRAVIAVTSETSTGERFETRSIAASVDAVYRVPVGAHTFGGRVGYGRETFVLEPASPASPDGRNAPPVPRAVYRYVRFLADADTRVAGPLHAAGHMGMRFLLGTGDLDTWLPDRRAVGFDLGVAIVLAFDVATIRLYADYVRYAFDFDPSPGGEHVVGGASDNYVTLGVAVGVRARARSR